MAIYFFNTLSRKKELFVPIEEGIVRMYTCGPTVYNFAHIGNFRAYVFEDLLRRYLKYAGYKVVQVMNLTDVDDKTIRGARELGITLGEYTQKYKEAFFEDIDTLNIERAEYYPAATEHIDEMIKLIDILLKKGYAYQSEDGSIYFSITKFKDYGKLSHLDLSSLKAGARVSYDEYQKDNLGDFALWKAWHEDDGDVWWDSPWGRGRPGWHIECSAMSMKYLGESFDIHTGGIDNIFPHHEDEIAQSEAATGKQFVKYWLHCGHLIVEGRKMSKSLGNFYTLRDILNMGYSPREIRFVLLNCHYRQSLDFSFASLNAARASLQRIDEFIEKLDSMCLGCNETYNDVPGWVLSFKKAFTSALDDDLNIAQAFAIIFDFIREGNKLISEGKLSSKEARVLLNFMWDIDRVVGLLSKNYEKVPPDLDNLARQRAEARKMKNFALADSLRKKIEEAGWVIQDLPDGYKLRRRKI